jgi:hypothetical protein
MESKDCGALDIQGKNGTTFIKSWVYGVADVYELNFKT